ncbi:MAG: hypothetical protein ABIP48_19490 [Planctomycetota bacterium]
MEVVNHDDHEVRLLNVRLGSYQTGGQVSEGGQGFPVYLDGQFFFSLAHPSGWAMGQEGQGRLRHFPGATLAPGERFSCMETVLGVAEAGQARRRFLAHVRGRSRRVVRGHDRPYAIIDNFGSWSLEGEQGTGGMFARNTERALVHSLQRLSESRKLVGGVFDLYSVDFWHDVRGDMTGFAPQDFPNGFAPNHDHLPGVYSTEAIHNAVIETLRDLDEENPEVFLMLYWGHHSPWWIVHCDTIFEPSLFIEAAHPGPSPTPYARDSVTQCLDQAHWYCEDVPRLGKESLGFPGGTKLTFTLVQGYPDGHNLGRLRLAVTAAKPPVPVPAGYGLRPLLVTGHVPPCADGGTLVVSAQMSRGSAALAWRNIGSYFHVQGRLAGQTIPCQPVLGRATHEAAWQAWRIAVEPSGDPQPFELSITATLPADVELDWKGHCIPN